MSLNSAPNSEGLEPTATQSASVITLDRDARVSIALHGPGASIDDAVQAGEALKRLLESVGEVMGVPEGAIEWKTSSVQFQCDGCGLLRADRPDPGEGWTYDDGKDFCPECTALTTGTAEQSPPS